MRSGLPAEIGVHQDADILRDRKAEGGRPFDDGLFVAGGKTQGTRPVAVAVLLVPLAVGLLSGVADRHDESPFHGY